MPEPKVLTHIELQTRKSHDAIPLYLNFRPRRVQEKKTGLLRNRCRKLVSSQRLAMAEHFDFAA
jgi:hypothetical protein